jgi:drug/metabolite transporter (DMT)-like permease
MKLGKLFFFVFGITFLLPANAHAYIDPGSGALVMQMLLAAFFGLCFYLGKTRNWIITLIKRIIGCIKRNS